MTGDEKAEAALFLFVNQEREPKTMQKLRPIRSDSRWSIGQEFTGHATGKAQWVIRFCDDYQDSRSTKGAALLRCIALRGIQQGALTIEGI